MASANFIEEALTNTIHVDDEQVRDIVGSLENGNHTNSSNTQPAITTTTTTSTTILYTPGSAGSQHQQRVITKPLQTIIQQPVIIKQNNQLQVPIRPNIVTVPMNNTTLGVGVGVAGTIPVSLGQTIVTSQPNAVQMVAVRAQAPVTGQKNVTAVTPRVVINSQLVGARPNTQGITLQAIPGFQPGQQGGHLLLKTENGQYQLLRVGPPSTAATVAPQQGQQQIRLTTVAPASSAVGIPTTTQLGPPIQATTVVSSPAQMSNTTVIGQQKIVDSKSSAITTQKSSVDNMKEKCRKFLSNLLDLSSKEPKQVEKNVRILIQELIDMKVEPEAFCARLEKLLDASPQPCLIGFLKKTLPFLRQSLVNRELVIDGIHPPPANVVLFNRPTSPSSSVPSLTTLKPATGATIISQQIIQPANRTPLRNAIKPATSKPIGVPAKTTPVVQQANAGGSKLFREKDKKPAYSQSFGDDKMAGDDDINDVAAMGGVNLAEESQKILRSTELIGTQIRSVKDEHLALMGPLQARLKLLAAKHGLDDPPFEVASLISHALQERVKNLIERLACIAEHRMDVIKLNPDYEPTQDVKGQLKFLEDLDRVERKRREDNEREILLRAAKSRSKTEDPEQVKLKEKAKEMQRAEMEEMRQREANLTALQAIGPRKKARTTYGQADSSGAQADSNLVETAASSKNGVGRSSAPVRARMKRVNYRDLLYLLEQERDNVRSQMLYKCYLK